MINPEQLEDIVIQYDPRDYPDFANAYLESATYEGRDLTDEEIEWLEENEWEYFYNYIFENQLYI